MIEATFCGRQKKHTPTVAHAGLHQYAGFGLIAICTQQKCPLVVSVSTSHQSRRSLHNKC